MAITQAMCTSFKQECFQGIHDLENDTIMVALYESSATLNAATTAYTVSGEVSGAGYTAGGVTVLGGSTSSSGTTAIVDFTDPVFPSVSVTARGALIYNSSKADRAIAVLDFGSDKTVSNGDFVIVLPIASASDAILRFE